MDKEVSSKSHFHKRLHRQGSFSDIESAIPKITPDLLKSVIASGFAATKISENGNPFKSFSVPFTPFPVLPVYSPMSGFALENTPETAPLTIFYNGTVTVFDVPREKAETIMRFAEEGSNISLQPSDSKVVADSSADQQKMKMLESNFIRDPSIKRSVSVKRFLEKRKKRSFEASLYSFFPETPFLKSEDINYFTGTVSRSLDREGINYFTGTVSRSLDREGNEKKRKE